MTTSPHSEAHSSPSKVEKDVKATTSAVSQHHEIQMEDEPELEISFFGFPLPAGWREENYGYESEDSPMPKIVIFDDKGIQVPKREITRRIEAHRRSQRPSTVQLKDERVPRIFQKFWETCKKELGQTPVKDGKSMKIIQFALNSGGLTEPQIYDLFEEWFAKGRPDDETIQITRALSSNNINGYKARTRI